MCCHSAMAAHPLRIQIGADLRAARMERRFSLRALSARCGVSKSHIANLETGRRAASPELLDRITLALDAEAVFRVRRSVVLGAREAGSSAHASHDLAHARCVDAVRRGLERRGIDTALEQPVNVPGAHGWVDLLAFERIARRLIVVEVKTQLLDLGGLLRQVHVYARGSIGAARTLGWRPAEVLVVVVLLATRQNNDVVSANRSSLRQEFPVRGRAVVRTLLDGAPVAGRGLVMMDPGRPGRQAYTSCRDDGRRTDAPYADYADGASGPPAVAGMRCTPGGRDVPGRRHGGPRPRRRERPGACAPRRGPRTGRFHWRRLEPSTVADIISSGGSPAATTTEGLGRSPIRASAAADPTRAPRVHLSRRSPPRSSSWVLTSTTMSRHGDPARTPTVNPAVGFRDVHRLLQRRVDAAKLEAAPNCVDAPRMSKVMRCSAQ